MCTTTEIEYAILSFMMNIIYQATRHNRLARSRSTNDHGQGMVHHKTVNVYSETIEN